MSTENKYTPHIHAEAIKAWADGKTIEFRRKGDPYWCALSDGIPMWHIGNEYRIKPKEVVDYTIVFKGGCPGSNFFPSVEEVNERYTCWSQSEGYLKRTTVDGKVVKMEFIPK